MKVLLISSILLASCAKLPPSSPDQVTVDLRGAICAMRGHDAGAPGFAVFLCITDDAADLPHLRAIERHSPVLMIRVPAGEAADFAKKHPWPEEPTPIGRSSHRIGDET